MSCTDGGQCAESLLVDLNQNKLLKPLVDVVHADLVADVFPDRSAYNAESRREAILNLASRYET
jgi:hypothetical protein